MSVGRNALPVETTADLPGFCSRCGRRLVVEDRVLGFDGATGKPHYTAYAYCRGSWMERNCISPEPHGSFVVAPRPKPSLPPANPAIMGDLRRGRLRSREEP